MGSPSTQASRECSHGSWREACSFCHAEEKVARLTKERDAARGVTDYILNACRLDSFSDGLQTAEDYIHYSLGTASLLYHVEGYDEICRERGDYRQAALELNAEIRDALAWMATGAEPSVAHNALLKTADKWSALLEEDTNAS